MKNMTNGDIGGGGLKFSIFEVTSFLSDVISTKLAQHPMFWCSSLMINKSTLKIETFLVDTRRHFNVYTTSHRRLIDVETTSCVYWVKEKASSLK